MSVLATRLVRTLRENGLLVPGDRIAVAVSGGGDSVALLHLLAEVAPRLEITLAGVVHLHHGLRGVEADEDLACVVGHAESLGLPLHAESADVAATARAGRLSIEAAGRAVREACFARARASLNATHVATGHTMDDQAETVLLRLARGTGVSALSGIRPARPGLVRPLLGFRRAELRGYVRARGLGWREDASNEDEGVARNRMRHRVLPLLAAEFSPRVAEALARAAAVAADEDELLGELARQAERRVVDRDAPGGVALDRAALAAAPRALQRRLVFSWLKAAAPASSVGMVHVEAVLALAEGARRQARLSVPGLSVVLEGGRLRVDASPVRSRGARHEEKTPVGLCHLPVPGVLSLEGLGMKVSAERLASGHRELVAGTPAIRAGGDVAVVDADAAGEDLAVRFRRPGDRLRPLGMAGHRKLQDLLVDRKVPREARDRVPLVVDAHDRIIWVAGHVIAADVRVTLATTRVLLLQLQRSGGVV